jgi:phage protein U
LKNFPHAKAAHRGARHEDDWAGRGDPSTPGSLFKRIIGGIWQLTGLTIRSDGRFAPEAVVYNKAQLAAIKTDIG